MADTTEKTVKKNLHVRPRRWERIEWAAEGTAPTANQFVVALAIEALDRRERPHFEAELRIARCLIAAGRENDFEEIRAFISTTVPDPNADTRQHDRDLFDDRTGAAE